MNAHRFYVRICLIMIQSAVFVSCTGGHTDRKSTASKRDKNTYTKEIGSPGTNPTIELKPATPAPNLNTSDAPASSDSNPVFADTRSGSPENKTPEIKSDSTQPAVSAAPSATPVVAVEATVSTDKSSKEAAKPAADQTKEVAKPAANSAEVVSKPATDPAEAAAKSATAVEVKNSIDKRKGLLATDSHYFDKKEQKNDLSGKACSVDVLEENGKSLLQIKMGDFNQKIPVEKTVIQNHLNELKPIEKTLTFSYFIQEPSVLVIGEIKNFDNKDKQESGVYYNRAKYIFRTDAVKTEDEAKKVLNDIVTKLTQDKDFKDVDYVQDFYKFQSKDNKITGFRYVNRRAIPGTGAKTEAKTLNSGDFKTEADLFCKFAD